MFCGHWNGDLTRLLCFFLVLAGVTTKPEKPPKPTVSVTQIGLELHFESSTPTSLPQQCWNYKFTFNKCNEKKEVVETKNNPKLYVEYDTACRYTVQAQVIYSSNCGGDLDIESDMSEPVNYESSQDVDPNLGFKVVMIITPLLLCCSLVAAIVLFRRNKDVILPKIPDPSLFFKDMLTSTSDGFSKSLAGGKLYVPIKEVVASGVSLEPTPLISHPNHDTCIPHMGNEGDGNDSLCKEKDTESRHSAAFH